MVDNFARAWLPDDEERLPGLVAVDGGEIRAGLRAALGDDSGDVIGVVEEVES